MKFVTHEVVGMLQKISNEQLTSHLRSEMLTGILNVNGREFEAKRIYTVRKMLEAGAGGSGLGGLLTLDLGVGYGACLAEAVKRGAIGHGLDIDLEMLVRAYLYMTDYLCLGEYQLMLDDVCTCQLPLRAYDVVICSELLEHLSRTVIGPILTKIRNSLTYGGFAVFTVPLDEDFESDLVGRDVPGGRKVFGHVTQFKNGELKVLLEERGFGIDYVTQIAGIGAGEKVYRCSVIRARGEK